MKNLIAILALVAILSSSCFVNRTTVGFGPDRPSIFARTYSKAKQQYILFGLIRLNETHLKFPPMGVGFEIKSSFSLEDGFLTLITGGIYGQRTVRILINEEDQRAIEDKLKSH